MFQFHTGSIKRMVFPSCTIWRQSFNSTLVRLKDQESETTKKGSTGFNSTLVRLKADLKEIAKRGGSSFNSTLVRLKVKPMLKKMLGIAAFQFHTGSIKSCASLGLGSLGCSFNSTLVRLKE